MLTENEQKKVVNEAKGIADWFEVDFTISIFGHPIISWHYPPRRSRE